MADSEIVAHTDSGLCILNRVTLSEAVSRIQYSPDCIVKPSASHDIVAI